MTITIMFCLFKHILYNRVTPSRVYLVRDVLSVLIVRYSMLFYYEPFVTLIKIANDNKRQRYRFDTYYLAAF